MGSAHGQHCSRIARRNGAQVKSAIIGILRFGTNPTGGMLDFSPDYLTLFDYTVQGLKQADPQVRVGGPACEGTNIFQGGADLSNLLNHCHTGTNAATGKTGTQIDFLTYHWYADNAMPGIGITGNVLNANNSAAVQKMVTDSMKHYSWFTGPVF